MDDPTRLPLGVRLFGSDLFPVGRARRISGMKEPHNQSSARFDSGLHNDLDRA